MLLGIKRFLDFRRILPGWCNTSGNGTGNYDGWGDKDVSWEFLYLDAASLLEKAALYNELRPDSVFEL